MCIIKRGCFSKFLQSTPLCFESPTGRLAGFDCADWGLLKRTLHIPRSNTHANFLLYVVQGLSRNISRDHSMFWWSSQARSVQILLILRYCFSKWDKCSRHTAYTKMKLFSWERALKGEHNVMIFTFCNQWFIWRSPQKAAILAFCYEFHI